MRWPGAEVEAVADARSAINLAQGWSPDLLILDLGLPADDGVDVLQSIRQVSKVPVVILTANDDQAKRVLGLESGADDFILKPFNYAEFLARVNAVLRRADGWDGGAGATGESPALEIDIPGHRVVLRGSELHFTPTEWQLLTALWRHTGEVLTIRKLSEEIWDTSAPQHSAIKTVVRRLRLKLEEDPSNLAIINSIRGAGYRFDQPK